MTGHELLKALREVMEEAGDLDETVTLLDVLDGLGSIGLPGASELYMESLPKPPTSQ